MRVIAAAGLVTTDAGWLTLACAGSAPALSLGAREHGRPRSRAPACRCPPVAAADYLVDRRRIRRKLTFWRVAAALVVVLAIVAVGARGRASFVDHVTPHIARVKIGGLITGDDETLRILHDVETSQASALILADREPRRHDRRLGARL